MVMLQIYMQLQSDNPDLPVGLATACYLIQEGNADLHKKNRKGKTPLDLVPESMPHSAQIIDIMKKYYADATKRQRCIQNLKQYVKVCVTLI